MPPALRLACSPEDKKYSFRNHRMFGERELHSGNTSLLLLKTAANLNAGNSGTCLHFAILHF